MNKPFLPFLLIAVSLAACSAGSHSIFHKKTPHEEYAAKLDKKDLDETPEGRQWLAASELALARAQAISLPYRQQGYFHADKARALGLKFKAKRGERVTFTLSKKTPAGFQLYADVFQADGSLTAPLLSADTSLNTFFFDAEEAGDYILRLQPPLFQSGAYNLSIALGPSLGFPVSGTKAKVGSFWGADRDGGKRRHEGIDIFAAKRTPVVAAADGYVTGVREGGIGGKVVWMRVNDRPLHLYYAHLDEQLVSPGQSVKKGDVLGLVGNTGNARTTPPHLHFGIYTIGGPIDPHPFVNKKERTAPALSARDLRRQLQLAKAIRQQNGTSVPSKTTLVPLAVNAKGYIAELPDGSLVQVPATSIKVLKDQVPAARNLATRPAGTGKGS